ncbi:MAG: leucyl/phenylalanyl-tRNA--protein transferase [Planctomycetota bacterium]
MQRDLVDILLAAYRGGAFPMADTRTGSVYLVDPPRRGVIPLDDPAVPHIPRSLARTLRANRFELTTDQAFAEVVGGCAAPRILSGTVEDRTWIADIMVGWYEELHARGHAHSVEAWRTHRDTGERALVGGVFGVSIGAAFFAESKFHRARPRLVDGSRHPLDGTDASKVCLIALIEHLRACRYAMLDTQFTNPHIARFGVVEIDADDFRFQLIKAVHQPDRWQELDPRSR